MEMIAVGNKCQECWEANVRITDNLDDRKGFSYKIVYFCRKCKNKSHKYTSPFSASEKMYGCKPSEINVRLVMAFREIGKGHESIKTFARCMNMHSISNTAFRNISNKLFSAYENSAIESMQNAANEAKMEEISQVYILVVSIDGTWQKRGHSSLNGVVTAVSKGKCLDVIVLSKHCRQCLIWGGKKRHNRTHKLESGT